MVEALLVVLALASAAGAIAIGYWAGGHIPPK
jgi:hypothetical protein